MLNAERIRLQPAIEVARGIQLSLSEGALPHWYYDALCLLKEQIVEVEYQSNLARNEALVKSQSFWEQ